MSHIVGASKPIRRGIERNWVTLSWTQRSLFILPLAFRILGAGELSDKMNWAEIRNHTMPSTRAEFVVSETPKTFFTAVLLSQRSLILYLWVSLYFLWSFAFFYVPDYKSNICPLWEVYNEHKITKGRKRAGYKSAWMVWIHLHETLLYIYKERPRQTGIEREGTRRMLEKMATNMLAGSVPCGCIPWDLCTPRLAFPWDRLNVPKNKHVLTSQN